MKKFLLLLTLIGCSVTEPELPVSVYDMTIDPRLEQNDDGYYLMEVVNNETQTIHRITGYVYENGEPLEYQRIVWESSHFWLVGDSLGFIVRRDHCPAQNSSGTQCVFVVNGTAVRDTIWIDFLNGQEVATINGVSISRFDGEINTIFAPIFRMRGDTVEISATALFPTGDVKQMIQVILQ